MKFWWTYSALVAVIVGCGGSTPDSDVPDPVPAAPPQPVDEATEANEPVGEDPDVGEEADAVGEDEELEEDEAVGDVEEEAKPLGNTVEETRTTEVIRNVVQKNRDSVRRCYDQQLKKEKGIRGTLTITFQLDPKGSVSSASLHEERSTLKQPELVQCAIAAIRAMRFPPSSRGFESTVNYPFDFKP